MAKSWEHWPNRPDPLTVRSPARPSAWASNFGTPSCTAIVARTDVAGIPIDGHVRRRQPGLALGVRGVVDRKTHCAWPSASPVSRSKPGTSAESWAVLDVAKSASLRLADRPARYRCRAASCPPSAATSRAVTTTVSPRVSHSIGTSPIRTRPATEWSIFARPRLSMRQGFNVPLASACAPTVPATSPPPVLKVVSAKSWASGRVDASSRETERVGAVRSTAPSPFNG